MRALMLLTLFAACAVTAAAQEASSPDSSRFVSPFVGDRPPLTPMSAFPATDERHPFTFHQLLIEPTGSGPPPFLPAPEQKLDLALPFRLQMQQAGTNRILMNVLGAVQAGATGYIAYRHVKKYGLFR